MVLGHLLTRSGLTYPEVSYLSTFFPWDLSVVKISPEWVTSPEQGKSSGRIATFSLWTPILDKLLEYKRNWIQHVNRMSRNRLPRVMKRYSPTGRRNHGRPLKRLLDTWDQNGSTSGPTPWQIYNDDEDTEFYLSMSVYRLTLHLKHWNYVAAACCYLAVHLL